MAPAKVAARRCGARGIDREWNAPRSVSWGELHGKLIERLARRRCWSMPSTRCCTCRRAPGRFLQFAGGEPTTNLLRAVHPMLRIELRAALYRAAQIARAVDRPSGAGRARRPQGGGRHPRIAGRGDRARRVPGRLRARAVGAAPRTRPGKPDGERRRAPTRARGRAAESAPARHRAAVRRLDRGTEGEQRRAAGDERGAALGHRGARDQPRGAAVDQRGTHHRQPGAQEQGRRAGAAPTATCRT